MFSQLIAKLQRHEDLSVDEAADAMEAIMDGRAQPSQIAGLLVGLAMKGERPAEIVGLARTMRARATKLSRTFAPVFDTCGTGGDGADTFNVSTVAALVLPACGVRVAKHGNRSASSRCGSADVLEALGVNLAAPPAVVEQCLEQAGIAFFFAPVFHPSMKHAGPTRKELGIRTAFNLLGPLTNPAGVRHQVVGVFDRKWCEHMASALGALGLRRAAVVHGEGNLDELAVRGESHVALWDDTEGLTRVLTLTPRAFGCDDVDPAGLAGGDAAFNAQILRKTLAGHHIGHGERLEAILRAGAMTAALGLELLEPGAFELQRLPAQYKRAVGVVTSGAARLVLHKWREVSQATIDADVSDLDELTAEEFAGVE